MSRVTVTERIHTLDGMRYRVWSRPVPGSTVPPLVLLHGYAACIEQWGRFMRDIGPDVPVYALDLIGFGLSSKPRRVRYGSALYLRQFEDFRQYYELPHVVPVGHSLGGMLAIEWASAHPQVVDAVVTIAPGGLFPGDALTPWQARVAARIGTPVVTRVLYALITHLPYRMLSAAAYADRAAMDPHTQATIKAAMRSPGAAWSFSALMRDQEAFQAVAEAATLRCPLHVIWGTKDGEVSRAEITQLQRRFPDIILTELAGGGHCVHEERAREVTAEVRTLLVGDGLLEPIPAPLMAAD